MKATYVDHMGTDLSVVNAAKVSFGKKSEWVNEEYYANSTDAYPSTRQVLSKGDQGLINFLARGCTSGDWEKLFKDIKYCYGYNYIDCITLDEQEDLHNILNHIRRMPPHWTPFAHTAITIHLKMPIFVARQIMKTSTGMVYNEISRRYVDDEPEFYVPEIWRKRAENVKQGSSDEAAGGDVPLYLQENVYETCLDAYKTMIATGVAPEQARMVLPQSMYTEVIATGNLYSWANLFIQRTDSHAQKETQDLAKQIGKIVAPLFPVSWKALTE